jgi:hypothetical protein
VFDGWLSGVFEAVVDSVCDPTTDVTGTAAERARLRGQCDGIAAAVVTAGGATMVTAVSMAEDGNIARVRRVVLPGLSSGRCVVGKTAKI